MDWSEMAGPEFTWGSEQSSFWTAPLWLWDLLLWSCAYTVLDVESSGKLMLYWIIFPEKQFSQPSSMDITINRAIKPQITLVALEHWAQGCQSWVWIRIFWSSLQFQRLEQRQNQVHQKFYGWAWVGSFSDSLTGFQWAVGWGQPSTPSHTILKAWREKVVSKGHASVWQSWHSCNIFCRAGWSKHFKML